ncbi:MAG: Xaa-Pro aminopeptidase [Alphaproteobacteria bacterium]|nr:Xaa-Pro aminopeptidase [Alphaproteobacteria bacterium]
MKYEPINPNLFIQNRQRFVNKMQKNSLGIFKSNLPMPSNGDAFYNFKQNSNIFWLCGIEQENTWVLLNPNASEKKYRQVLVLDRPNELKEKWDGKRLTKEQAIKISGIETIIWNDQLEPLLQKWIHAIDTIYLDSNENDRRNHNVMTSEYELIYKLKQQYPLHQFQRAAAIFKYLRSIKSPIEIQLIAKAIDITNQTFQSLLKIMKPGIFEYDIEAHIMYSFIRNKAKNAYNNIIASGDNARILHYIENSSVCKNGDLILMDFGAEYANYCADLTRTVPVNGKFTSRQKEVYTACLNIHQYAKSILKPGVILRDYTEKVGDKATKEFLKIGIVKKEDTKYDTPDNKAYQKYLYHGISHHLGIDVHDYGITHLPLEPGMVLTVEPGIYIQEENMGIRLENNVVITATGHTDLMKHVPIQIADIESLYKK